jgi:hypothetical protein
MSQVLRRSAAPLRPRSEGSQVPAVRRSLQAVSNIVDLAKLGAGNTGPLRGFYSGQSLDWPGLADLKIGHYTNTESAALQTVGMPTVKVLLESWFWYVEVRA